MTTPRAPINKNPKIKSPTGMRLGGCVWPVKVGMANGAGGVYVARRVAATDGINTETRVGLIVGVGGINVGGESMRGKRAEPPEPPVNETYKAYTHPTEPGTPS